MKEQASCKQQGFARVSEYLEISMIENGRKSSMDDSMAYIGNDEQTHQILETSQ
jgi:hypothetical protein